MYQGPSGPFAALVHVVVRRPIVGALIAVVGLSNAMGTVDSGPIGPGIHGGAEGVMEAVLNTMAEDDPGLLDRVAAYEAACQEARAERDRELSDEAIQLVLDQYKASSLTVGDVRANDNFREGVEIAYCYSLIFGFDGDIDRATKAFLASP